MSNVSPETWAGIFQGFTNLIVSAVAVLIGWWTVRRTYALQRQRDKELTDRDANNRFTALIYVAGRVLMLVRKLRVECVRLMIPGANQAVQVRHDFTNEFSDTKALIDEFHLMDLPEYGLIYKVDELRRLLDEAKIAAGMAMGPFHAAAVPGLPNVAAITALEERAVGLVAEFDDAKKKWEAGVSPDEWYVKH